MALEKSTMTLSVLFFYAIGIALASSVGGRGFSVDVAHGGKKLSGPAGYRATLLKHGRFVPPELDAAAKDPSILIEAYRKACTSAELGELEKRSGSAATYPEGDDNGFYTTITAGKSKLNMLIDSGSSDLWVYSDRLPKNETKGHKLYNTSTGKRLKGYSWKIVYGDKTGAAGIVYRDTVKVGKATATSQAVEAATSISEPHIAGKDADGILGLGFEPLNSVKPEKQSPLWQNLAGEKKLYAVDLNYLSKGSIDFGYVDSSKAKGPITYVPVKPARFWYFNFTEYEINGKPFPIHRYKDAPTSLIDTGTSYLVVSHEAAAEYYKNVKFAKRVEYQWIFPCRSKVGNFGLKISGRVFYVYSEYAKQPLGDGFCYGSVQGAAGSFSQYDSGLIIGDPFIVGNYIVFDGEQRRLGFAHKHLNFTSKGT